MKMRALLPALLVAVCSPAAAAQEDFISPMIETLEAGVLCAIDSGEARAAPDTVAGTTHVVDDAPPFVSTGSLVPAVLGIGFGVRAGLAEDALLDGVTMQVTHPPFAGNGATEQSFITTLRPASDPGTTFYQFDYGYELALGDWTMTASRAGVAFYEVTFTVVPPAALPDLAGVCGYLDLLS